MPMNGMVLPAGTPMNSMNSFNSSTTTDDSPRATEASRSRSPIRSVLATLTWGAGTFLLSLLILIDLLIGEKLPGGLIYVAFVLGPILGICGAIAMPCKTEEKIILIVITLCLLPIQLMIIGTILLAISGFDGTH